MDHPYVPVARPASAPVRITVEFEDRPDRVPLKAIVGRFNGEVAVKLESGDAPEGTGARPATLAFLADLADFIEGDR